MSTGTYLVNKHLYSYKFLLLYLRERKNKMQYEKVKVNSERWFDLTPLLNEEFRNIEGYEGYYQISNYGRVKSLERELSYIGKNQYTTYIRKQYVKEKINKCSFDKDGYIQVGLSYKGKVKTKRVHQLVAVAFIPNGNNLTEINHKDLNKQNNCVDNLEWCSYSYNTKDAIKKGANTMSGFNRYNKNKFYNKYGKLYQYDKNKKLLNIYNNPDEAHKKTNVCIRNILQCINHEPKRKTAGGYVWLSEKEVMNNEI